MKFEKMPDKTRIKFRRYTKIISVIFAVTALAFSMIDTFYPNAMLYKLFIANTGFAVIYFVASLTLTSKKEFKETANIMYKKYSIWIPKSWRTE